MTSSDPAAPRGGTLEELPGLVILVPAAVGMRGNVFGALGSRIGTSVHAGTFRLGWRIDTEVGQNLASSVVLSMALAFGLAVVAEGFSIAFGVEGALSLADFVVVSVVGGIIPIAVATKLHFGFIEARRGVWRGISEDLALVYFLATAIFVVLAPVTDVVAAALSLDGPGFGTSLGVILLAGLLATTLSNFVAYAGALSTFRFGLDPDDFGIPLVSSASDPLGSASRILCLVIFGLT